MREPNRDQFPRIAYRMAPGRKKIKKKKESRVGGKGREKKGGGVVPVSLRIREGRKGKKGG